jgi:hypothetical protein
MKLITEQVEELTGDGRTSHGTFREGDKVVLTKGSYEGTPGVFLRFREDPNWADIREWNGRIREHPVVWLAHVVRQP